MISVTIKIKDRIHPKVCYEELNKLLKEVGFIDYEMCVTGKEGVYR